MVGMEVAEKAGIQSLFGEAAAIQMKFERLLTAFGRSHAMYNCNKKLQNN